MASGIAADVPADYDGMLSRYSDHYVGMACIALMLGRKVVGLLASATSDVNDIANLWLLLSVAHAPKGLAFISGLASFYGVERELRMCAVEFELCVFGAGALHHERYAGRRPGYAAASGVVRVDQRPTVPMKDAKALPHFSNESIVGIDRLASVAEVETFPFPERRLE